MMLKTLGWMLFALLLSAITTSAQTKTETPTRRTFTFEGEPGKIWMLNEVGMIAGESDGKVMVNMVSAPQGRAKGYESVDLKEGDIIAMANGKKVTSAQMLSDMYDSLAVGSDLKMGIKRGDQMMMVTVKKADPESLPKRKMIINTGEPGKPAEFTAKGSMDIDPAVQNITVVGGAGIIVGTKDGHLVVAEKLPNAHEVLGDAAIEKGDIIVGLQDQAIDDVQQFEKAFDDIKVGEPVTITVRHGEKELKASFTKQESRFRTMMKKN